MATLMLLSTASCLLAFLLMGQAAFLFIREESYMTLLAGISFLAALFLFVVPFIFGKLYAGGF